MTTTHIEKVDCMPPELGIQENKLSESSVESGIFGQIALADILSVYRAVTNNDEVRGAYPEKIVQQVTSKVGADVAHCIALSTRTATQAMIEAPEVHAYASGGVNGQPVETVPTGVSGTVGNTTADARDVAYTPAFDEDESEADTTAFIAQALVAEAAAQQQRRQQAIRLAADKLQAEREAEDAERIRLQAQAELTLGDIALGRRESAFLVEAVKTFDPVARQRELASAQFNPPEVVEPARPLPTAEQLLGRQSLARRVGIAGGRIVAHASAIVHNWTVHAVPGT